jgi:hypothetical protein
MSKILPIKYNVIPDIDHVIDVPKEDDVKTLIVDLLFNDIYDCLLIGYNNSMYVVERDGDTSYSKRQVNYHPCSQLVMVQDPNQSI